jgi:hypothetical protein
MIKSKNSELLSNERVRQEIERYKWCESEKAGYDIGSEKATADWLARFGDDWKKANVPAAPRPAPKRNAKSFSRA